ncbi:exo-beta-N-acetylmuramidase NamZ domain-containing protein [Curtobacterium sp. 9128]|uniref:exo-beta-N-acetylmuramidase NamZ family protein n=1 Tax=Curtobacterium sp. 9128 TaxID=1793722 RepID=UPI0011A17D34|nr:DUF1343 domain-containing protein [Curtobacterium sp. 9128]
MSEVPVAAIDRLLADPVLRASVIGDARVGLVTNDTAVTADLERSADALQRIGVRLAVLFGPEHGMHGTGQAGESESVDHDHATGLPVVDTYELDPDRLAEQITAARVDLVLVDLPDIGTRFWTYPWTMVDCLVAADRAGVRVVVLDRPNPIGGTLVEGPGLDPAFASFVGRLDVPIRHGMTLGELARTAVAAGTGGLRVTAALDVVGVAGWADRAPWARGGGPWVTPSPNLPTPDTAFVYPGTGLVEGTNLSEGRGTTRPFETVGAPWLDDRFVPALRDLGLPGVALRETRFRPTFHKYAGQTVRGVVLHVTDRDRFRPVRTGLAVIGTAARLYPDAFAVRAQPVDAPAEPGCPLDRLWGSDRLRLALAAGEDVVGFADAPDDRVAV